MCLRMTTAYLKPPFLINRANSFCASSDMIRALAISLIAPSKPLSHNRSMPKMRTEQQVSAGGVVYRKKKSGVEFALIKVGPIVRWQLPKGIVDEGETP